MKPSIETLEKIADKYQRKIKELNKGMGGITHFNHVANNLCQYMFLTPDNLRYGLVSWEEERSSYRKALKAIRAYFTLIERFPEFGEAELKTSEGYFPDVQSVHDKNLREQGWKFASDYYIHEANKRLRRK